MFRQSFAIAAGWLIALACLRAQTANDCWTVRLGLIDRHSLDFTAFAQEIDKSGNAYVLRYLSSQTPSFGFICAKFDPAGNKLWEKSYAATNGSHLYVAGVALDPQGSLVLATTLSTNFSGEHVEVRVMRLDAEGNQRWLSRFQSRGFQHTLVADAAGNIYVTGVNFGAAVNSASIPLKASSIALTKLDVNGSGLWCTQTNSVWPHEIFPFSLTIGPQGDLYASWSRWREDSYREFITARLSPDGVERWRSSYVYMNLTEPYSLLVDGEGNVFTTGSIFYGAPFDDHFTIKYSADGSQLWVATWPEQSEAQGLGGTALDNFGNFYCTLGPGWLDAALVTAKYDPEGNRLWTMYEPAALGEEHYGSLRLMIDSAQTVFVSGLHYSTNDYTRTTIRYMQNTTPGLPVIRRQPTGGRVRAGSTVKLEVLVTGVQPLVCQWRLDGNDIPGETNMVLVLSDIAINQSGTYSVLVTNTAGCAISLDASLTVVEIPPFRLGVPTFIETIFQEPDGSMTTNHSVRMLLTGGRPGWLYTVEVSTNLVRWQPYLSRGVDADGSAFFQLRREIHGDMFFRASTRP